tara:strand:- start:101 stop:346 length:246 start_codon:yes stop_codon:yes gene_type:complete
VDLSFTSFIISISTKEIPTMSNLETKIKEYLEEEIQGAKEIIEEYRSEHRPKCDDGSDDFIEGNLNLAQRLLLQIKEWEVA